MRSYNSALFFLSLFVFVVVLANGQDESPQRKKRFLRSDLFNPLSESLVDLNNFARDLSDQLVAQASSTAQRLRPQVDRAASELTSWGARLGEQMVDGLQKRGLIRPALERELESEVEVLNPEEVQPPKKVDQGEVDFDPFVPFSLSFGILAPWYTGPNVCVVRNEIEEPESEAVENPGVSFNLMTTRCVPSESSYVCTQKTQTNGMRKTVVIKRQCCHGYVRRKDGRPGCSALQMDNLIVTLKLLEMNKFLEWVGAEGLEEKMKLNNYTVFAPSNEAIMDYEDDSQDNEISAINPAKKLTDLSSIVAGHITNGFENLDVLDNDQLLNTYKEESTIRINKYRPSHEVITANCVPVTGKNNFATNGIVHMVSGVLPRPTKSVGALIDDDEAFTTFRKLLIDNGLMEELKKEDEPWTLFVPSDMAFDKLPESMRRQIESGDGCLQSILQQHLVRGTVCSGAVITHLKVRNLLNNDLHMTKDEGEKLRVDGALVELENTMGTNGVIHVIDKVLIPPQARSLIKALEDEDRTDLLELLELSEMTSQLNGAKNVTLFVPSKEALKRLSNETKEMLNDPAQLKEILQHHLIETHLPTDAFSDNKKLTTLNGHGIHLKLHEGFPGIVTAATVQCAYIVKHDQQVCGAVIHKINKMLLPPKGDVVETLKRMEGHDIALKLLHNTDLEKKLSEEGPFTFLAPTDKAFERMTQPTLDDLLANNTLAEQILKLHILPEVLCCNGVNHDSPFHHQYVRSMGGGILPTHRSISDRVRFGRATVVKCDTPATNGLVHSVNKVIVPERPRQLLFGMDLWPFF